MQSEMQQGRGDGDEVGTRRDHATGELLRCRLRLEPPCLRWPSTAWSCLRRHARARSKKESPAKARPKLQLWHPLTLRCKHGVSGDVVFLDKLQPWHPLTLRCKHGFSVDVVFLDKLGIWLQFIKQVPLLFMCCSFFCPESFDPGTAASW